MRRPPPIHKGLRPAVEDLREYITSPRDEARMKRLHERGDDRTTKERSEFGKLLGAVQTHRLDVALWLTGPHLDTINTVLTMVFKKLTGHPVTSACDKTERPPPIPAEVKAAVDRLREYITPPCEAARVKVLCESAMTGRASARLVRLLEAAQRRAERVALWLTGPHLDEISANQVEFLKKLAQDIARREVSGDS